MFLGVDHIGVGVPDVDAGIAFYGSRLGFGEVLFDYTGELHGLEALTGSPRTRARVAMLRNPTASPLGVGRIKLVQLLDGDGPAGAPPGQAWGELGICEICLHARGVEAVHRRLVDELGCTPLIEPLSATVTPNDVALDISYVADPWGGKIELIDWTGLWSSLPGPPRSEGVNHVAFGVADIERTVAFYRRLGFDELLFESDGFFDPMAPWYEGEPPRQLMKMLLSPQGAGLEPVELVPQGPDCRGAFGHLGPMEFAIGVSNLDRACAELAAAGIELHGEPQRIDVATGEWRYAYFVDPDALYVSLVEARY